MDADARLEALEEENERLREEIARLKEALGFNFYAPLEWGLTPSETRIFGRLLKGGPVTKEGLMAALYRDFAKDEAEIKIVDVFICKMRRKLKRFNIVIKTLWGAGYELDPVSIAEYKMNWAPQPTAGEP